MNKTQHHLPDVYEENYKLTAEISSILSGSSSSRKKESRLKKLQESVDSPLAQSHIAYYVNRIRAKRYALYARIITIPFILAYLLYILYRTYFFIYPEKAHYDLSPGLTQTQQLLLICLIPVLILAYYLVRFLLFEKKLF